MLHKQSVADSLKNPPATHHPLTAANGVSSFLQLQHKAEKLPCGSQQRTAVPEAAAAVQEEKKKGKEEEAAAAMAAGTLVLSPWSYHLAQIALDRQGVGLHITQQPRAAGNQPAADQLLQAAAIGNKTTHAQHLDMVLREHSDSPTAVVDPAPVHRKSISVTRRPRRRRPSFPLAISHAAMVVDHLCRHR